jgi:hypothetical protein
MTAGTTEQFRGAIHEALGHIIGSHDDDCQGGPHPTPEEALPYLRHAFDLVKAIHHGGGDRHPVEIDTLIAAAQLCLVTAPKAGSEMPSFVAELIEFRAGLPRP